jgi:hypothetical protein
VVVVAGEGRDRMQTSIGIAFLSLKFEMSFLDIVDTALCPLIVDNSSNEISISFLSFTAPFTPRFKQIFSKRGACIIVE